MTAVCGNWPRKLSRFRDFNHLSEEYRSFDDVRDFFQWIFVQQGDRFRIKLDTISTISVEFDWDCIWRIEKFHGRNFSCYFNGVLR